MKNHRLTAIYIFHTWLPPDYFRSPYPLMAPFTNSQFHITPPLRAVQPSPYSPSSICVADGDSDLEMGTVNNRLGDGSPLADVSFGEEPLSPRRLRAAGGTAVRWRSDCHTVYTGIIACFSLPRPYILTNYIVFTHYH